MPYFWYAYESDEDIVFYWEVPSQGGGESQVDVATVPTSSVQEGNGSREGESSSLDAFKSKYENLPYYLKSCFDYCCLFTFKHSIGLFGALNTERIVRLLVAEGLVEDIPGEIIEVKAKNVIDELVGLGFLRLEYDGYVDYITVPEPFYQFSVLQGNKEDFTAKAADLPIRAFIRLENGKNIPTDLKNLPIQSLFMIDRAKVLQTNLRTLCRLQFLLVFDLFGQMTYLPYEMGDLVNLRYLSLKTPCLVEIPRTIDDLQKLQTLQILSLHPPTECFNIKTLKHLSLFGILTYRFPMGIERLLNLQSLCNLYAGDEIANELSALTQLRQLCVIRVSEDHINELLAAIMKMKNLVCLALKAEVIYIEGNKKFQIFPTAEAFSPPPLLQELCLSGSLVEMPEWISSMSNLTRLILKFSDLSEKQTSILRYLPKLRSLNLYNAYKEKVISKEFCTSGGFPELEVLIIQSNFLVEWTGIVNGAFPRLKCLQFMVCSKLMFLPEGLQKISTLQELSITYAHPDLARRLNGSENYKIKHIPNVVIEERLC